MLLPLKSCAYFLTLKGETCRTLSLAVTLTVLTLFTFHSELCMCSFSLLPLLPTPILYEMDLRFAPAPSAKALGDNAGGTTGRPTGLALAFATAQRMVNRIHVHAARVRP